MMQRYVVQRLFRLIVQVWFVLTLVFVLFRLVPGDPASLLIGSQASETEIARLREAMGLDAPIPIQYTKYLSDALKGDFGHSHTYNRPVLDVVLSRIGPTINLMVTALSLAVLIGVPAGLIAGLRPQSLVSKILSFIWVGFMAIPNFWLGLLLILLFAVNLGWLPAVGYGSLKAIILPATAIAARLVALIARVTRSSIMEVAHEDYVRTARSKGLAEGKVILKHIFQPAIIPVITMVGMQAGYLLGGSVVIENLFSYPGTGQLLLSAVSLRDYNLMQGITMFFVSGFLLINLLVDVLYVFIDPRISYE